MLEHVYNRHDFNGRNRGRGKIYLARHQSRIRDYLNLYKGDRERLGWTGRYEFAFMSDVSLRVAAMCSSVLYRQR